MQLAHGLRKLGHALRNALAREALEVDPETPPRTRRARSLARALFAIEDLPVDPPVARPRRRDARAAREELPLDPEPAPSPRRASILRALVVPERLPEDPPAAPRARRHRWLRWLLVPEPIDPPRR
jgi:hypothetical protein